MRLFPAIVCSFLALCAACEHQVDAALLHLSGLESERLEPGATLRVEGRGFPPGRVGTVRLTGIAHRAGQEPIHVQAETTGRAESSEGLVFESTQAIVDTLGGRGTFVGTLRVEFEGSDRAVVSGELGHIALEVRPGGRGAMSGLLTREREGQELLSRFGITPRADDGGGEGILVETFAPGSAADRGGIHKGDRIIALGPLHVGTAADLVPPPSASTALLVIERPGWSQPVRIPVALGASQTGPSADAVRGATAAAGLFLLLVFVLSPIAKFTARAFRALCQPGPSVVAALLGVRPISVDAPLIRRVSRLAWMTVGVAAVVVAFGVLPFTARFLPGALDAAVLAMVTVGLAIAARAARPGKEPVLARAIGVVRAFAIGAPAIVAVSAVAMTLGTFRIEALSSAQAGVPWAWGGFSSVPGLLALPASAISLLVLPRPPQTGTSALVLDRVRLFIGASLITVVFLGGYRLPFYVDDPLLASPVLRLAAATLFVGKAVAVVIAGSRLRRAVSDLRGLALASAACALLAAGTAFVALVFPGSGPAPTVVGPVAFIVTVVIVAVGVYAARNQNASRYEAGVALFS